MGNEQAEQFCVVCKKPAKRWINIFFYSKGTPWVPYCSFAHGAKKNRGKFKLGMIFSYIWLIVITIFVRFYEHLLFDMLWLYLFFMILIIYFSFGMRVSNRENQSADRVNQ